MRRQSGDHVIPDCVPDRDVKGFASSHKGDVDDAK